MENNGRRCLAEKLDRDLGRDFIHRLLNFVVALASLSVSMLISMPQPGQVMCSFALIRPMV